MDFIMKVYRSIFARKVAAVSGGFDPCHQFHIAMILEAAKYGDVIVILNSDEWLNRKKGYNFMSFEERRNILLAIKGVYDVVKADDDDNTVCESLRKLKPDFFCNGGDRKPDTTPEVKLCNELGIRMLWNIGGSTKGQSSSKLIQDVVEKVTS